MIRKIININEELCNGCELCVNACHESAIGMVNGKAKLLRDDYCDGLGDCLPVCPTGAITFVEREALEYNEEEVQRNIAEKNRKDNAASVKEETKAHFGGCPGSRMQTINRDVKLVEVRQEQRSTESSLRQWPVQIQLVPVKAPYFNGADLLIAADCTAFSYGDFHSFMKNKITLIGCPKLDEVDYSDKLTQILSMNDIESLTVIRMEVPCCGGIVHAVKNAMMNSGKLIPWRVITLTTDGQVLEDK